MRSDCSGRAALTSPLTALAMGALIGGLLVGCAGTTAQHGSGGKAVSPATYKMTTETPASLTTPDEVQTRIGTLKFHDGFPDAATVDKVYDNLAFQRGVQAYLAALPAVSTEAARRAVTGLGPANQCVLISENLLDSKSLFLTANTTTPYSVLWLDTSKGPVVLEVPPDVLGPMDDAWFRWVVDVGFTGPDKGKGGKYLLLPPGYKGEVPEGYFVARSRTFGNLLFFRTFLKDGDPKPGVEMVKTHLRVYPLGKADDASPMKVVNISGMSFNTIGPSNYDAFEYVNHVIQTEPEDAMDPDTLGAFASIGIEKGKPFEPDAKMKKTLAEAAAVGDATVRSITYRCRIKDAYFYPDSAWMTLFIGGSYQFEQKGVRLLDAYSAFFFYATGITPSMAIKMVGKGSAYAGAFIDAKGNPLDGDKTYKVHLPPNIPAKEFWSLTIYDSQTRSMLQTDQQFPAAGSDTKGIKINPDSSVDVYFAPKAPAGMENNWIQTIPGKGFNVLLRLYGPGEPWFDKTWRPGEFEEVKG